MTKNIIWCFIYAIFSTYLVHPWCIKNIIKDKKFLGRNNRTSFEKFLICFFTIFNFFLSFIAFCSIYNSGYIIQFPFTPIPIILCILALQIFVIPTIHIFSINFNMKKYTTITIILSLILISISYSFNKKLNNAELTNIQDISSNEIEITHYIESSKLKNTNIFSYNSSNTIYFIQNSKKICDITIVEKNAYIKNISINNSTNTFNIIRRLYPNSKIKYLGIIISKQNEPFKVYSITDIEFPYTNNYNSYFVLYSCNNDEITEIK